MTGAILTLAVSLLWAGCAKQARPPGGPVDREAPTVVAHVPAMDATLVSTSSAIEVEFNEPMERKSVEESVFLTPGGDELDMSWSGRRLHIEPQDGLARDRTYTVTIGTDARDLRRNRMEDAFQLSFSTGQRLDEGALHGRVIDVDDTPANGAFVWAFDMESHDSDLRTDPTYVTQTGADGTWRFERLAPAAYRVIAFLDGDRDQQPDGTEPLAVPSADAIVDTSGSTAGGDLRLHQTSVDVSVLRVSAVDEQHALVVLSDAVRHESLTVEAPGLVVHAVYPDPADRSKWHVVTGPQEEGRQYALRVGTADGWLDGPEEPMRGTQRQDQRGPAIAGVSPEGATVSAQRIVLTFSEAMQAGPLAFTGADSTADPSGVWSWLTVTTVEFASDSSLAPGSYDFEVDLQHVRDVAGNTALDSLHRFSVDVLEPEALATISVATDWPNESDGVAIVRLSSDRMDVTVAADSSGSVRIHDLPPGTYRLHTFYDRNRDGLWQGGRLHDPYEPSEPYAWHGSVELKAGDIVQVEVPLRELPE